MSHRAVEVSFFQYNHIPGKWKGPYRCSRAILPHTAHSDAHSSTTIYCDTVPLDASFDESSTSVKSILSNLSFPSPTAHPHLSLSQNHTSIHQGTQPLHLSYHEHKNFLSHRRNCEKPAPTLPHRPEKGVDDTTAETTVPTQQSQPYSQDPETTRPSTAPAPSQPLLPQMLLRNNTQWTKNEVRAYYLTLAFVGFSVRRFEIDNRAWLNTGVIVMRNSIAVIALVELLLPRG